MKLHNVHGYSMLEILVVMALTVVVAAIAIPMSGNAIAFLRLSGDVRKVSNAVAVAKMRAASDFTKARLYVDRGSESFHMETYRKTGTPGWVSQGGTTGLSQGVSFGYGSIATPPPSTQPSIGHAPPCLADDGVTAIASTSCIVFNSRGIPIDNSCGPTPVDAIYLTD
jgi:prepilin-type N-terminal cleavage/methylation domain-containing protein